MGPASTASGRAEPRPRLLEPREPLLHRAELELHRRRVLLAFERRAQRLGERLGQLAEPAQLRRVVAIHVRARAEQQQPERADELNAPGYEPSKDARFAMRLPLEDEDGPIGLLLVGPRSDLNRYNAAQLRGLNELAEPLAEALRAAMKRAQHAETMHRQLGSVEERLARLEQSRPRLSPT